MSAPAINVLGNRFGQVLVLARAGSNNGGALWRCICDCGKEFVSHGHVLANGKRRSCGCVARAQASSLGSSNRRHGMSGTTEYNIWLTMRARCSNPQSVSYRNYGARGIAVCERWDQSFDAFFADMGPRPSSDHSIDRKDGSLGYSPENCRWATREEQAKNKSCTHQIEWNGEVYTFRGLVNLLGLSEATIRRRINDGASMAQALAMKPYQRVAKQALTFVEAA